MTALAPSGPWDRPELTPRAAVALLLPLTAAVAGLIVLRPELGFAAVAGLLFATMVFVAFPLAIGALVVLMFVSGLPGTMGVPAASTAVVALAWFAILPARRHQLAELRGAAPLALYLPWVLLGWMAATWLWAPDGGLATSRLWQIFTAVVTVPIIAIGADRPRIARIVVVGYVAGAAMIVFLAIVLGPSSYANADPSNGRLEVANFSANLLGATAVTALVLVPAVYRMASGAAGRAGTVVLGGLLMYGLVGTQSRSGFVALAVAAVAALAVCRGRRRQIAGAIAAATVAFGAFIAVRPGILERTETGDSTGRTDLWKAAVAVWRDHPLGGTGIGNFTAVSPSYALQLGTLEAPDFVTVDPLPPHNLILEALAETGAVGLVLLLAALGASLWATWQAARIFGRRGDGDLELLTQLVLVSQVAVITAGFFLPITGNRQLWTVLAVGVALFGIARRADARAPERTPVS